MFGLKTTWTCVHATIDLKNCVIVIHDANAANYADTAQSAGYVNHTCTLVIGEGNLTYSTKRNIEYIPDRGLITSGTPEVKEGDEVPMEVRLDCRYDYFTSNTITSPSPADIITNKYLGTSGSAYTSSDSTTDGACRPYAVDIVLTNTAPSGCGDNEVYTFPDFRWEQIDFDIRGGTLSVSGRCLAIAPTVVRSA